MVEKIIIISRYQEDYNWVKEYPYNYIVYNKGEPIYNDSHIFNTENIGGNQRDIFHYIYYNYDNLPDLTVFIQAIPWDHCKKEIFDKLIGNEYFTPLEYYGMIPANDWEQRDEFGKFLEINNSWYIGHCKRSFDQTCLYSSFDEFMNKYFKNYNHIDWIRFPPGSQLIIEKRQALYYPRWFWKNVMMEMTEPRGITNFIVERALWMIFQCNLELREQSHFI
jgi:hypothetical protein